MYLLKIQEVKPPLAGEKVCCKENIGEYRKDRKKGEN